MNVICFHLYTEVHTFLLQCESYIGCLKWAGTAYEHRRSIPDMNLLGLNII